MLQPGDRCIDLLTKQTVTVIKCVTRDGRLVLVDFAGVEVVVLAMELEKRRQDR